MKETFVLAVSPKPSFIARKEIIMNPADCEKLGFVNYIYVDIQALGKKITCLCLVDDQIPSGEVKLSKRCFDEFGQPVETIELFQPEFQFVRRGIPKVENINKKVVYASRDIIERFSNHVELINPKNGYRMNLTLVPADYTDKKNTVFINRYMTLLLDYKNDQETPLVVIKKQIPKIGWFKQVIALLTNGLIKGLEKIGQFLIGSRELSLRVSYLFPFDENYHVARIHPNTRKFLGVEETDKIIVEYNGKMIKLPVLDLDPEHVDQVVAIQDPFLDSHVYIGIPAISRKELEIPNIGTVVKVRRSMRFLFFKHINKLILPMIALWFAIIQTFGALNRTNVFWIVLLTIILTPLVIFTSLSDERSKVK